MVLEGQSCSRRESFSLHATSFYLIAAQFDAFSAADLVDGFRAGRYLWRADPVSFRGA